MKIKDIITALEEFAPLAYQESYDNAGLIIGDKNDKAKAALLCIDITEEIIEEAITKGANLIISHHPIIFSGLKKITGKNYIERIIIKAIKHDIAIYACHTNIDSVIGGVNSKICDKIGLTNCKILSPISNELRKLVTFVPEDHAKTVRDVLFNAGAGTIGEYDNCSFSTKGNGSFRASESADPFVGEIGKIHIEPEIRIETIFPKHLQSKVINSLLTAHPYEEVAYDIYSLDNKYNNVGIGMIGELKENEEELPFLKRVKEIFKAKSIRHTRLLNKKIKTVAVCGGSGSYLLNNAIASKADIFITGDYKYHQFFDAEDKIIIADIGHYESEQFTKEIFYEILTKKLPKFAVYLSEINSNPINYL
jgi:dinuclear metal center YbgI/SA1388 family protein